MVGYLCRSARDLAGLHINANRGRTILGQSRARGLLAKRPRPDRAPSCGSATRIRVQVRMPMGRNVRPKNSERCHDCEAPIRFARTQSPSRGHGPIPQGIPPFETHRVGALPAGLRRGVGRAASRDRRHRGRSRRADLRQHHRGARAKRRDSEARRRRVLQPLGRRTPTTRCRRSSGRWRRFWPSTATRST